MKKETIFDAIEPLKYDGDIKKERDYEVIGCYDRYEQNPFLEEAVEKIQSTTVRRTRKTGIDKSHQHTVVNSDGEVEGYAQFLQIVEVDEEKFAKIYISNFAAFYGLNEAGMRVFHYIITNLKPKNDVILFNLKKCMLFTEYKTRKSVLSGLGSLLKNGIIARTIFNDEYFINPLILFNGDRVAYTRAYVKKKKAELKMD